nr:MAG TPA: chromosome segregation protein [Bacteriophage sp.]
MLIRLRYLVHLQYMILHIQLIWLTLISTHLL